MNEPQQMRTHTHTQGYWWACHKHKSSVALFFSFLSTFCVQPNFKLRAKRVCIFTCVCTLPVNSATVMTIKSRVSSNQSLIDKQSIAVIDSTTLQCSHTRTNQRLDSHIISHRRQYVLLLIAFTAALTESVCGSDHSFTRSDSKSMSCTS